MIKFAKIYIQILQKFEFINAFVVFLVMFVFYLIQYAKYSKMLIPPSYNGIGFNFSSLYLMLNEYFTPYLSFTSYEYQTKSTMGMLYSFFLNPDLKNINSTASIISNSSALIQNLRSEKSIPSPISIVIASMVKGLALYFRSSAKSTSSARESLPPETPTAIRSPASIIL